MTNSIKAVIFNYNVLLDSAYCDPAGIGVLLNELRKKDIKIVVFSTKHQQFGHLFAQAGLPQPDLILCKSDVGATKGSPKWIEKTCSVLNIRSYEILYVGDDAMDWRTAINSSVFYLHATWTSKPNNSQITAIEARFPRFVFKFATHFLMRPPRFEFSYDWSSQIFSRTLLYQNVVLPCSSVEGVSKANFKLHDVLTYKKRVLIDQHNSIYILLMHAITSLYLEGLLERADGMKPPRFLTYPGSQIGSISTVFTDDLSNFAKFFHGMYDTNLNRFQTAANTSLERYNGGRVDFTTQTNTVNLQTKVDYSGRTVVVIDDFSTSGKSLSWASNLITTAGAARVVQLAIGKYSWNETRYFPQTPNLIRPFTTKSYNESDFVTETQPLVRNRKAATTIQESCRLWKENRFYW